MGKNKSLFLFVAFIIGISPNLKAEMFPLFLESESNLSDSLQDGNYYLDKLEVDKAWSLTRGDKNVKVGVLSSGVNYQLELLKPNVDINPLEDTGLAGVDDDKNGYVDDLVGVNTYDGTNDPMDYLGFGTHSATLIGGKEQVQPIRTAGILQETSLVLASPMADFAAVATEASIVEAIGYLVSRGVRIVSLEFGSPMKTKNICEAIETAKESNVLFVVPAGNGSGDLDQAHEAYPALCPSDNILVVAASDKNDRLASFSNYGKKAVHVAAPGVSLAGYDHLGQMIVRSGTSFSAALTAGVCALALSENPTLTYQDLKSVLIYSVDPMANAADRGKIASGGRINAYKAVRMARNLPRRPR